MPRRKARLEIGYRAFEEVDRIFNVKRHGGRISAAQSIGCNKKALSQWNNGVAPDAIHLQRLNELGADVIYILTGARKNG